MKFLDRLINFIFSLAMLVVSVVVLLVLFNFIDSSFVNNLINTYVWGADYRMIVIITACVVFLAGLKTTIFLSDFKKRRKIPIMVSSDNGSVQIAGETIESTAKAVAQSHEEVKEANVKMVNKSKGVEIYMSILVTQDTNIRTITREIQEEVKEKVHETTGVLVLNTDIKVKNIVEKNKKVSEKIEKESKPQVQAEIKEVNEDFEDASDGDETVTILEDVEELREDIADTSDDVKE